MKIKVVKMDDRTFGVAINGEVFEVNDGCTSLGEAGSVMRALNSKSWKRQRRPDALGSQRQRHGVVMSNDFPTRCS